MAHRPVTAGVFTIESLDKQTRKQLKQAMLLDAEGDVGAPLPVYTRRLVVDDEVPALFAIALDSPFGMHWMLRGTRVLALIPVKHKHRGRAELAVRSLAKWVSALAPAAAVDLVSSAYEFDDDLDDSIHVRVHLPLDGLTTGRGEGVDLDDWLNDLCDAAEAVLERQDVDADVILFNPDEELTALVGHITVDVEDEDDAVEMVEQAILEACSTFTPQSLLRRQLVVEIEDECVFDLLDGLIHDESPED